MKRRMLILVLLVSLSQLMFVPASVDAQVPPSPFVILQQFSRGRDFALLPVSMNATAISRGFTRGNLEGFAFAEQVPGTVPLDLFFNGVRNDFFSTATTVGKQSAISAGYQRIATIGFIFDTRQPNTVPLNLLFSPNIGTFLQADNFTTTLQTFPLYGLVRTEGFIMNFVNLQGVYLYKNPASPDYLTRGDTFNPQLPTGYIGGTDADKQGCMWVQQMPGTVPLKIFWNQSRGDVFTTGTAQGERDALNSGYTFIDTAGFVYPTQVAGTIPLLSAWNAQAQENITAGPVAIFFLSLSGSYNVTRVEGYVFPSEECARFS